MIFDDKLLLYLIIFLKKYICKKGCGLHKKARALCLKAPRGLCALVRLAPFTTMGTTPFIIHLDIVTCTHCGQSKHGLVSGSISFLFFFFSF